VKLHKKIKDPQNDTKEIENFRTSKYQNKKPSKFTRRKVNTPSPPPPRETSHKKKIEDF
jgi:hypothetical protein